MNCLHCNRPIVGDGDRWAHDYGPGSTMIRCKPTESGQPYGLNATPKESE